MKHTIYKVFAGLLLFGSISCTANYMDINSNPYQPGSTYYLSEEMQSQLADLP